MTLDEAIKHCNEVVKKNEQAKKDGQLWIDTEYEDCCADHRQLAEWLRELQELRDKHWGECRQIAHYDDELQKLMIPAIVAALDNLDANDMIRELKKLLKIAMADLREAEDCSCCIFDSKQCPGVTGDCTFKWKHHDEAIELMGGENI